MDYEKIWKVLAGLVNEFIKRKGGVPSNVMNDLRSAKTLIQILKADPTCTDCIPKIEECLARVEVNLMPKAQEEFGTEFVQEWAKRLEEARKEAYEKDMEARVEPSRFVSGVPKGKSWVRIQTSEDIPLETVKNLARELKISLKTQEENHVLLYGDKNQIKLFVKKMSEKLQAKKLKNAS